MKKGILKFIALCGLALCLLSYPKPAVTAPEDTDLPQKEFTTVTEVWRTPYKPQHKTGTCWSFSTVSFLESEAYRLGKGEFELSQIYNAYYAFLEKAQRNARMHGSGVFQDGGLPHDVIYIMKKYGAVPLSDYRGLLPGEIEHDHREMSKILRGVMDSVIKIGKDDQLSSEWTDGELHSKWLEDMRDILDNHIGAVPETIKYKGRRMTPVQFADEVLELPLNDYIEVTSYSFLPLYGKGELTIRDNWLHYDDFYNVTIDDYIRILDHAFDNGYSVVFDLHTTREMYTSLKGYCELDAKLKGDIIDQDTRDTMLENWSTVDQHLVHGVGIAKDENGKRYYKTKDSVGEEMGDYRSLDYLSENFVRAKALFFMIHKDGLPKDIRSRLGIR